MEEMFVVTWICLMTLTICIELIFYIVEFIDWLVDKKYNKTKQNKIIT